MFMCNCFCFESEFVIQSKIFWWFLPPLIDDKMAYILVLQLSAATDGNVHTGHAVNVKKIYV